MFLLRGYLQLVVKSTVKYTSWHADEAAEIGTTRPSFVRALLEVVIVPLNYLVRGFTACRNKALMVVEQLADPGT